MHRGVGHNRRPRIGYPKILRRECQTPQFATQVITADLAGFLICSWPFDASLWSYCLDTANPIDGDQNIPSFPGYANNVSSIDIALVKTKNISAATNSTSVTNATSTMILASAPISSSSSSSSYMVKSSTVAMSSSSTATPTAKSGAQGRTISGGLVVVMALGTILGLRLR